MISHNIVTRAWEQVRCDLFELKGKQYLVCVDYFSDFYEIDRMKQTKSDDVIYKLKCQFARHGIPNCVITDNGPPFSSKEFTSFAQKYEFEHVTSSREKSSRVK